MSFQPVIAGPGLAGWRFLQRTYDQQAAVFNSAPQIRRDTEYFAARIGEVTSAEQLVADRRLMRVALGAFGLSADIDNRYFLRKILEEGTLRDDALANRLADPRYKAFSAAFAFGDRPVPRTALATFPGEIIAKFQAQQFEVAVGDQDQTMRLALNLKRALPGLLAKDASEDTKWFEIMGTPPLRKVFETALGLPPGFAQIDLDQQLATLKEKSARQLDVGSIAELGDAGTLDRLVQSYLVRAQISQGAVLSSGTIALSLLAAATPAP